MSTQSSRAMSPCSSHRVVLHEVEEGVTAVEVEPKLGIGQRAFLLHTGARPAAPCSTARGTLHAGGPPSWG